MSKKNDETNDNKPEGRVIDAPTPLVRDIGTWKQRVISLKIAEIGEAAAKAKVLDGIEKLGLGVGDQVTSKHGAVPLCQNSAQPKTDTAAVIAELARVGGISAEVLESIVAKHTTMGTPSKIYVKAVTGWAAEAKKEAA